MVGNVESYGSGWETLGNDSLAKKIIESDEFTTTEKLKLVRALDGEVIGEQVPRIKDTSDATPYVQPIVIYRGWGYDDCEERRYKLTC